MRGCEPRPWSGIPANHKVLNFKGEGLSFHPDYLGKYSWICKIGDAETLTALYIGGSLYGEDSNEDTNGFLLNI